jgi:GR25 family glycosyltransferase involved in LPS biosynthesis
MNQLASYEVLIVSLDTDILRREACKSQLIGWNYRFIPAIDGRSNRESGYGLVTAPVEAIWQSHNLALRGFLATESRYCLILEDDFAVKNPKKFEDLLRALLNEEFDLAQVGWLTTGLDIAFLRFYEAALYMVLRVLNRLSRYSARLAKVLESKLRPRRCGQVPSFSIPDSFFPGAHAYVVSRDFAEAVLNLNNPIFLATDDFYSALSKMRSFNVFRTRKSFVAQKGDSSAGENRFTRR